MNGNFLSMMAQRYPQMQQQNPQQMLQMLMARRQQPQASIMPVGQPMRQPTSPNATNPPMNNGGNMLMRGPRANY